MTELYVLIHSTLDERANGLAFFPLRLKLSIILCAPLKMLWKAAALVRILFLSASVPKCCLLPLHGTSFCFLFPKVVAKLCTQVVSCNQQHLSWCRCWYQIWVTFKSVNKQWGKKWIWATNQNWAWRRGVWIKPKGSQSAPLLCKKKEKKRIDCPCSTTVQQISNYLSSRIFQWGNCFQEYTH